LSNEYHSDSARAERWQQRYHESQAELALANDRIRELEGVVSMRESEIGRLDTKLQRMTGKLETETEVFEKLVTVLREAGKVAGEYA